MHDYEPTARSICESTWRVRESQGERHLSGVVDAAVERAVQLSARPDREIAVHDFMQPSGNGWLMQRGKPDGLIQAMANVFRAYRLRA